MFEIDPNNKYRLIIVGDYNDADTIEEKTILTGAEILRFLPLIEAFT